MKRSLAWLVAVAMSGFFAGPVPADQTKMEEEQAERRQEVAKAIAGMGQPMTAFDYISFYLSGPAVVLEGFTTKPVVKRDAETAVRKLKWVNHVVNKIEELPLDRTVNDMRSEVLSIVRAACPQSYPQDHAYIRIKIDGAMNIALVGWADPRDKARLEAAVVQIQNLPLVKKVDNKVLIQKIG